MRWLRLSSEARTDAKLESLPDDELRVWHRLLCFANEQPARGIIVDDTPRLLAVEVARGDLALLQRTLASLHDLAISESIDSESIDDDCRFINWDTYQTARDVFMQNWPALSAGRERREAVFARDEYSCHYCGARGVSRHCDHIIPVSRGGGRDLCNLTTARGTCNQAKYNQTPEEWLS